MKKVCFVKWIIDRVDRFSYLTLDFKSKKLSTSWTAVESNIDVLLLSEDW